MCHRGRRVWGPPQSRPVECPTQPSCSSPHFLPGLPPPPLSRLPIPAPAHPACPTLYSTRPVTQQKLGVLHQHPEKAVGNC